MGSGNAKSLKYLDPKSAKCSKHPFPVTFIAEKIKGDFVPICWKCEEEIKLDIKKKSDF
jgi:hypothetical protein